MKIRHGEQVKKRILEYLSVLKLKSDSGQGDAVNKGPINVMMIAMEPGTRKKRLVS